MKAQEWMDVVIGVVVCVGVLALAMFLLSGCAALGGVEAWVPQGGTRRVVVERSVVVVPGAQVPGSILRGPWPGTWTANPAYPGGPRQRWTVVPGP